MLPVALPSKLSAAIVASDIVPLIVIGPPVSPVPVATLVTVPVPVMLLQPNPVLVVHVNALVAALHDGTASAIAGAGEPVAFPMTVLEAAGGRSPMTSVRKLGAPLEPSGAARNVLALSEASTAVSVPEVVTGEPETVNMFGSAKPTCVTVPVPDAAIHDATPEPFSLRTFVPLALPARDDQLDAPRTMIVPGVDP